MSTKDNGYVKVCLHCEFATPLRNNDVLCKYAGVVSEDHSCKKYIYDPLKRQPMSKPSIQPISVEDLF